jgi:hypothetical protein
MTELLERAIARLKTLPSSEQDAIALYPNLFLPQSLHIFH